MGMFDTVEVQCPHCEFINEVQSKAGECNLYTYAVGQAVPDNIAEDLHGTGMLCGACGIQYLLMIQIQATCLIEGCK